MSTSHDRRHGVASYLPYAASATFVVVVVPALMVFGAIPLVEPESPPLLSLFLGLGLALIAALVGSVLWRRRPDSLEVNFGELMLWSWVRRKRAEDRIENAAYMLGVDASGQSSRGPWVIRERRLDVLYDLSSALESKDPYTHGHSRRVQNHAVATATKMGLARRDIDELDKAAVLHDVGKIRLSDRLLRKPAGLTEREHEMVREHVEIGSRMVALVGSADVVAGVRHHHEWWNGSGYPQGLAGTDIPLFARIIAVADAYDAMTSTRPYRTGFARQRAIDTLDKNAGTQFDPDVVSAFIATLPERSSVGAWIFLAAPSALWRRISAWSKRTGGAGIATAVVLAALFALFGGALSPFTPSEPVDRTTQAPSATELSEVDPDVAEEVAGTRVKAPGRGSPRAAAGEGGPGSTDGGAGGGGGGGTGPGAGGTGGGGGGTRPGTGGGGGGTGPGTGGGGGGTGPGTGGGGGGPGPGTGGGGGTGPGGGGTGPGNGGGGTGPGNGGGGTGPGNGGGGTGPGEDPGRPDKPRKPRKPRRHPHGDPQPPHGKDCAGHKHRSTGHRRHCL